MSPAQIHRAPPRRARLAGTAALALLAGCADFDLDLRDLANPEVDTSEAARTAVENRPAPDDRGVISYPGYQVAVARRGDTVGDVAARVGLPARELARFNGAPVDARLNRGEVLALPRRVAEPSPDTGAPVDGPIRPRGEVDVATLAGAAIERAEGEGEAAPATEAGRAGPPAPRTGTEPLRHRVAEGETAFSIARRYDVPVEALAEWNGLDDDYTLRVGQILLIPPAAEAPRQAGTEAVPPPPGSGSPTPAPPSAAEPLPEDTAPATAADAGEAGEQGVDIPDSPDLGAERSADAPGEARFLLPVEGPIIRDFAPDREDGRRNEGIDIAGEAGAPVRAADAGTVAYLSPDDEGRTIVVLRHDDGLLTVYADVADVAVNKGEAVERGQRIASVGSGASSALHFEVRDGLEALDPNDFLQ